MFCSKTLSRVTVLSPLDNVPHLAHSELKWGWRTDTKNGCRVFSFVFKCLIARNMKYENHMKHELRPLDGQQHVHTYLRTADTNSAHGLYKYWKFSVLKMYCRYANEYNNEINHKHLIVIANMPLRCVIYLDIGKTYGSYQLLFCIQHSYARDSCMYPYIEYHDWFKKRDTHKLLSTHTVRVHHIQSRQKIIFRVNADNMMRHHL